MKSFTVSLESRFTVMARNELEAISIARKLVQDNSELLIPSSVSTGYPSAWEPRKADAVRDGIMEVYNNVTETWPPNTDDEVPF